MFRKLIFWVSIAVVAILSLLGVSTCLYFAIALRHDWQVPWAAAFFKIFLEDFFLCPIISIVINRLLIRHIEEEKANKILKFLGKAVSDVRMQTILSVMRKMNKTNEPLTVSSFLLLFQKPNISFGI